jgi:tryptophan synthase beta chain
VNGYFGPYGGQFVAETLASPLRELEKAYAAARQDPAFEEELAHLLRTFVGRPTALTFARHLSERQGGARIYLKREDLAHTGAHKINNAVGQALLARRWGKQRVVAETGAGQHGVAAAAACALLGLECVVFMGSRDAERQSPNVARMRLLGADVRLVTTGSATLKDAISEAIRHWITHVRDTHYLLGSAVGPHPFPTMVRDFQSVIGRECRAQCLEAEGRLPDAVVACVGGGSNAIGVFSAFLGEPGVRLIGVQAAGAGLQTGSHAAPLLAGRVGVLHGSKTYLMQNGDGQILETHSISAGLDYVAVGPQHSWLKDAGLAEYESATDREALEAFRLLARAEGIIPALESAHAVAAALRLAPQMSREQFLVVNLSGRGDKDLDVATRALAGLEETP